MNLGSVPISKNKDVHKVPLFKSDASDKDKKIYHDRALEVEESKGYEGISAEGKKRIKNEMIMILEKLGRKHREARTSITERHVLKTLQIAHVLDTEYENRNIKVRHIITAINSLKFLPFTLYDGDFYMITGFEKDQTVAQEAVAHYKKKISINDPNRLISRKGPFQALVRGIVKDLIGEDHTMRMQTSALLALQEVTESYIHGVLDDANILADHARRMTVQPRDLHTSRILRGHKQVIIGIINETKMKSYTQDERKKKKAE